MTSIDTALYDPATWEKNVRAKLRKHEAKVTSLRKELKKEETVIRHLNKILVKIEDHMKLSHQLEATVINFIKSHPEQSEVDFVDQEDLEEILVDQDVENGQEKLQQPSVDDFEFLVEGDSWKVEVPATMTERAATNHDINDSDLIHGFLENWHKESMVKSTPVPVTQDTNDSSSPPGMVNADQAINQAIKREDLLQKAGEPFEICKCSKCGKRFLSKKNLQRHEMVVHQMVNSPVHSGKKGEKPHTCYKCEKRFATRRELQKHNTTHTGEETFTCSKCDKAFATKRAVKIHKLVHHL